MHTGIDEWRFSMGYQAAERPQSHRSWPAGSARCSAPFASPRSGGPFAIPDVCGSDLRNAGYRVAYAVAEDNLRIGHNVNCPIR
jgi:hypothetical protein